LSATIVVAGDLCASGLVERALSDADVTGLWREIGPINRAADFSIVNLECPLTERVEPILKSGPRLWSSPRAVTGIRAAGFTAVCLANNHVLDAGPVGLVDTIKYCRAAGLLCVGAGEDYSIATKPLVTALNGIKLSVIAIAENEFSTTSGQWPGAWPFDIVDNARQIARVRQDADFVLVLIHGGAEYYPLPSPNLQKACRFFIEQGADAVICHHSHVAGGLEFFKGRPIVYGVGNLLFDPAGQQSEDWFAGYLVRLTVAPHETLSMDLEPYRQDPAIPSVSMMSGPERGEFLSRIAGLQSVISDPERLAEAWRAFCREREPLLMSSILCLTKPEAWLLHKGLLPTTHVRFSPRRLARLRNLFSCESHRESCEQALRMMLEPAARSVPSRAPGKPKPPNGI
jgi:hypothetical protein